MHRRATFAAAFSLLLATAAAAQPASDPAHPELWCGLALAFAAGEPAPDAPPALRTLAAGAEMLLQRAADAYRRSGYSPAGFAARRETLRAEVESQIAAGEDLAYSYEDCEALLRD